MVHLWIKVFFDAFSAKNRLRAMKGESTMAAEINNIPYKIYLSED